MSALAFRQELADANRRTRRSLVGSGVLHGLALLLWLLIYQVTPRPPALVEIEWVELEPETITVAAAHFQPVVEPIRPETLMPTPPTPVEERFERPEPVAEIEPEPQHPQALDDRLRRSLDRRPSRPSAVPTLPVDRPTAPTSPRPAIASATVSTADPGDLVRGTTSDTPHAPAPLERSTRRSRAPQLARVTTPSASSAPPDMAQVDPSAARREMEGALLVGPVADRPLRDRRMPAYPDWARREGVEASVTLTFTVAPDGQLRPNVVVQKTSGHVDFDRAAREALLSWRFAPLPAGGGSDQWGTLTFNFRLRD